MSAKKPPSKRVARSDDETRDRLTRELTAGLALTAPYKAIPAGLTMDSGNDSEVIAKIAFDIGLKYFEIQKTERWLAALRAGLSGARNIPAEAKASLLSMIGQIEHEFFGPYITAAVVAGVAAGLKGYGAEYVRETEGGAR